MIGVRRYQLTYSPMWFVKRKTVRIFASVICRAKNRSQLRSENGRMSPRETSCNQLKETGWFSESELF